MWHKWRLSIRQEETNLFSREKGRQEMSRRVAGEKVELDYSDIQSFFEERGKNKKLGNKYNYVLYQDDCPELAVMRDRQEKEKIANFLSLKKGQRVLDIGCGIGRWGEYLLEQGLYYVGIDASQHMIKMAQDNLMNFREKKLMTGTFQRLKESLRCIEELRKFDKIFVNGVFMYLNDVDYYQALQDMYSLCASECEIYVKESMGIKERLTLDKIYSQSLTQSYSAVYRSIEEYRLSLLEVFGRDFSIESEGHLYKTELENRKETVDYYYILKREE